MFLVPSLFDPNQPIFWACFGTIFSRSSGMFTFKNSVLCDVDALGTSGAKRLKLASYVQQKDQPLLVTPALSVEGPIAAH